MSQQRNHKIGIVIFASLLTFLAALTTPHSASAESEATPVEATPSFQGCERPTPNSMAKTERLAVIAKISLDAESEVEALIVREDGKGSTTLTTDIDLRNRLATFAAGSFPDTIKFVSMDRSCWSHFYGAQKKLAEDDEIGAIAEAKEWKDCLTSMFPDRVAIAKPYFSCFLIGDSAQSKSATKAAAKPVKKTEKKSGPAPAGISP